MSEYGVQIKNIVAGSIYEANLGVRDNLDMEDAMLSNSLLLDFLTKNGLNVWNGKSTRDVIGIDFKYGSRSYEMEVQHIQRMLDEKVIDNDKAQQLFSSAQKNKNKYRRVGKDDLRRMFYIDGVNVTYKAFGKKETIHYRMLFRSPGKAKKGVCMFICDRLYDATLNFMRMGISLPTENSPIVEMGAYSSLIASGVVGRIEIEPENVLVIHDFDSYMKTDAVSIETNARRECIAVNRHDYTLKNTMWDGQALLDSSRFPNWGDGYVLLRQHMTKCAAFCTHIQKFFKDYYGEDYETAVINDYWGNPHNVKDIQMITTENALKFMKFGVSYEYWCKWVHKNGCLWGVVKTSHKSKMGNVQRMSYQMVNALNSLSMDETLLPTQQYLKALQSDDEMFIEYLQQNKNFYNDYEVLLALVNQNHDFIRSEYFKERKKIILHACLMNVKSGKIIQNADNLTIVGSPYAMLMAAVGENPEEDPTFDTEDGAIQCYTGRFESGQFLAEFRSPFNSRNNLGYLHNHYHPYFDKYFDLGTQIIAINMVHTSFQDRNNGSDQDSDMIYVTNARPIVSHAKWCQENYPTIVNNIPKEKNNYQSALADFAVIDNRLAKAQSAIGESSNLAQIALSYTYNFDDKKYSDAVCILSVLAQVAIDSAKRSFEVNVPREIRRLKRELNVCDSNGNGNLYPEFWTTVQPQFNSIRIIHNNDGTSEQISLINKDLQCPMNEVNNFKLGRSKYTHTIPNSEFFVKYEMKESRRKCKRVEKFIEQYALNIMQTNTAQDSENDDYLVLRDDFDEMIEDIKKIHISNNYLGLMSYLIDRALFITHPIPSYKSNLSKNRSLLFKTLYTISPQQFLQCFAKKAYTDTCQDSLKQQ